MNNKVYSLDTFRQLRLEGDSISQAIKKIEIKNQHDLDTHFNNIEELLIESQKNTHPIFKEEDKDFA